MTARRTDGTRNKARNVRLKAKQSHLAAGSTFCVTAERLLVIGKVQLGREAIEKAKQSILWLRAHLDEPNHVPADSVHGIREQLTKLEKRVAELEEQLSSRRA